MLLCSTYQKKKKRQTVTTKYVKCIASTFCSTFVNFGIHFTIVVLLAKKKKKNLQIGISTWWFTNENHSQNAQLLCCIDLCLKFCMNYKIDTFIEFIQRSLLRLIINRHSLEKSTTTRQDFSSFRQKSSTLITFSGTKTCELSTTARGWSMISIIKPRSGMKWAQNIYLG